jgi:pimeloyl-ACP methyl ester carboxylesterase
MHNEPPMSGIESQVIRTSRLKVHLFSRGPEGGVPVIFLHGNVSSNRFWEETMLAMPGTYRSIAPDLRGYGQTQGMPVDATRGMRDWSDDLKALTDALDLGPFHLVAWSLGGGVAMQYAIDHPSDLVSLTLVDAMSPYGFGGTRDFEGTPVYDDYAGSGGGTANPEFVQRLSEGDRSGDSPLSPRGTMNAFYFKPPFRAAPEREEVFISSLLSTRTGEGFYPGDMTPSPNWPTVAPGPSGINNALSPKYVNLSSFAGIDPKPPVLWIRGADDQIVSDTSLFDFGFLGQIGAVPGWPGVEAYPPQPMVSQLRAVLDHYAAAGGTYSEQIIEDCGHSPLVEKPDEFRQLLFEHLRQADDKR